MKDSSYVKIAVLLLLSIFLIAGCSELEREVLSDENTQISELRSFSSYAELEEFIVNSSQREGFADYGSLVSRAASNIRTETMLAGDSSSAAPEYSETNVQVQGVDEADIVKTDGVYIYQISDNNLLISLTNPDNARLESKTTFEERPSSIFLNGDRLALFLQGYEEEIRISSYDFLPQRELLPITRIVVLDVSDRSNPRIIEEIKTSGSYNQARMINSSIYLISTSYTGYGILPMPRVWMEDRIIMPTIYYPGGDSSSYTLNTVTSFDINNLESVRAETFMLGNSDTIYMSKENLYLVSRNYPQYETRDEVFRKAVLPVLPSQLRNQYQRLLEEDKNNPSKIAEMIGEYYETLSDSSKKEFEENIRRSIEDYTINRDREAMSSTIHRLSVKDGVVRHEAEGKIPGHLLNQFSLDEKDSNLRVASTINIFAGSRSESSNSVYVLNENLEIIGRAENLGVDESIYSARFIEDRLYLVTFREIDPFFVIDLENPENPRVLGELKLPGFSSYLHPYDENLIIGIGRDAKEENGFVRSYGVKLSLFDVSNPQNPIEKDSFLIDSEWAHTAVFYDHKALLFSREKNLLVLPVSRYDSRDNWQGAYVFEVDENGFSHRGEISHRVLGEDRNYYWVSQPSLISRSLYIGDNLYTISQRAIKINSLENLREIAEIDLDYRYPSDIYYPRPYY